VCDIVDSNIDIPGASLLDRSPHISFAALARRPKRRGPNLIAMQGGDLSDDGAHLTSPMAAARPFGSDWGLRIFDITGTDNVGRMRAGSVNGSNFRTFSL